MQKRDYKPSRNSTHAQSQWAAHSLNKEATQFQPGSRYFSLVQGMAPSPLQLSLYTTHLPEEKVTMHRKCFVRWPSCHGQINDNSVNFLSLSSLSQHTHGMWVFSCHLHAASTCKQYSMMSCIKVSTTERFLYQPCLFYLSSVPDCPSPLPSPRIVLFTSELHLGFDYPHLSKPCPSLEGNWNIALFSLSAVSTEVILDALSPCSLELTITSVYVCLLHYRRLLSA